MTMLDLSGPVTATRHKPEDPLPTAAGVAREWGLGFALGQALATIERAAAVNAWSDPEAVQWVKRTWGHVYNARIDAASRTMGPRRVVAGGAERRTVTAQHVTEAWLLPTAIARAVEHVERASRMRSPEGVIEAIDDALAALGGWINRACAGSDGGAA